MSESDGNQNITDHARTEPASESNDSALQYVAIDLLETGHGSDEQRAILEPIEEQIRTHHRAVLADAFTLTFTRSPSRTGDPRGHDRQLGAGRMNDDFPATDDGRYDWDQDVDQDQIEVHWQHPRTELELPLLLVWPGPVVDSWIATIDVGVATVVCHEWLIEVETEDGETEIQKRAEEWGPDDEIPAYVAEALLSFDDSMNYGPCHTVANPYEMEEEEEELDVDEAQQSLVTDGGVDVDAGDRRCSNCGQSVEGAAYVFWLFHACRSCVADAITPDRWSATGTYRKWGYFPRWHMTEHPSIRGAALTDGGTVRTEHHVVEQWSDIDRASRVSDRDKLHVATIFTEQQWEYVVWIPTWLLDEGDTDVKTVASSSNLAVGDIEDYSEKAWEFSQPHRNDGYKEPGGYLPKSQVVVFQRLQGVESIETPQAGLSSFGGGSSD